MKKNLFLLFSIYFFVVQPIFVGVLWGQINFFRLGAINLVAIILIGTISTIVDTEKKSELHEHEKKSEPINEHKVSFHDHFHAVIQERKKKSELLFPSIMSLFVMIIVFFLRGDSITSTEIVFLGASVMGFIVFTLFTLLYKHRIHKHFWKLIGTKIYIVLLLCGIVFTAYDYYQTYTDFTITLQDYIGQHIFGQERIPPSSYIFTGEGTILGSGLGATTPEQNTSSDVFTIEKETGAVVGSSTGAEPIPTETIEAKSGSLLPPTSTGKQKIMDAVLYLLKTYNTPLINKQDISFTYVSFKNPYYKEWRTAYTYKMIGKTTNPSKYIVCESYIVMKGLLAKRNVPYTSSTVLNNFWAEAIKRDELNGCVKGKIVTDATL